MKDFFISYNKADRNWAEWIAWHLEEADYTTILQAWDFAPGSNFVLEMQKAAAEADRTIAVLSPDYLASHFTAPEWAAAFVQDPTSTGRKLIPIRVRECDPAGLLGPIVNETLFGLDERAAKAALLAAVKLGRGKPGTAPAFPPAAERSQVSQPHFPGSLPLVWNVPHLRNPNFTGREDLLAQLRDSLTSGKHAALTQAMHGLGGVGKTQTAIEYAYRYAGEYDAVLWVPANDTTVLAARFAALADDLGLQRDLGDQPATVNSVLQQLRALRRWLLIFDNAEEVESLRLYLPQTSTGHVIITSRNPEWRRIATPVGIPYFTTEEGVAFLFSRTGRDINDTGEVGAATTLSVELGGLAIALEQAAAYIDAHALSLKAYVSLFELRREDLLTTEPSSDYPYTLETVWSISVAAVRQKASGAAELLNLLAFFAPDDVPRELLRSDLDDLPEAAREFANDDLKLHDALRVLRSHSLITANVETVSTHRMVQAMARRSLSVVEQGKWITTAILLIRSCIPTDSEDTHTWPVFSRLSQHVGTVARFCETHGVGLEDAAFSLNELGLYLHERAEYESAQSYFERAIRMGSEVHGSAHPFVAVYINNLGRVFAENGDYENARVCCARALEIHEAVYGPVHPHVAVDLTNLGVLWMQEGELHLAREYNERALRINEAAFGKNHPALAANLNNLGSVFGRLRNLPAAHAHFERALQICESAYGSNHLSVAPVINNLAANQRDLGDKTGALAGFRRVLSICLEHLGEVHPKTMLVQRNIQILLDEIGEN